MPLEAEGCEVSLKKAAAPQLCHGSLACPLPRAMPGCLPGALRPAHVFPSPADKCGDTIKILSPGYLTSPGYPQSYHPSQKCEWLIQAPEPYQRIMINFNPHFDLEDRDCKWVRARGRERCGAPRRHLPAAAGSARGRSAGSSGRRRAGQGALSVCPCVPVGLCVCVCVCVRALKTSSQLSEVCKLLWVAPARCAASGGRRWCAEWGCGCGEAPLAFVSLLFELEFKKGAPFPFVPPRLQAAHGRDRPFINWQIFLTQS